MRRARVVSKLAMIRNGIGEYKSIRRGRGDDGSRIGSGSARAARRPAGCKLRQPRKAQSQLGRYTDDDD
jgi:hypothetical protein